MMMPKFHLAIILASILKNHTNTDLYIDHDLSFGQSRNVTTHKRLEFKLSTAPPLRFRISSTLNDIQYGQKMIMNVQRQYGTIYEK